MNEGEDEGEDKDEEKDEDEDEEDVMVVLSKEDNVLSKEDGLFCRGCCCDNKVIVCSEPLGKAMLWARQCWFRKRRRKGSS